MLSSILSGLNVQTVLIGVIVILVAYKLRYRLKYKLPPGPFSIPIIGTYEVFGATFLHELFGKYKKQYGPVFKIEFGPVPVIVLNDIDSVTEALVKRKADFANRPDVHSFKVLSEGAKDIAFANYTPTWKLHRKLALKALRQYLAGEQLEKVMHASLEKCLPEMAKETGPFNPEPIIDLMMFNILDAVCFGESVELDDPEFCRFMKLNKDAQELVGNGFIEDMFPLMYKVWTTQKYRTVVRWFDELFLYIRKKIEEHQKTFDPNHTRDLVDSMLLAKYEVSQDDNEELASQMTDTHIRQTIADIFFAGIDTSRITMYFAVRYMAGLPDIQVKVQEEIDRVVGKDQLPGLEHRDSLSYTEATLYEVMRMGNPVPLGLPHATLCDTEVGGYDVPQGTTVVINHWALHYDSKYWPDADKFEPARYLDQNGKLGMKPESWLPFSAGRRVCLGETVAKPELHLIFASLMQRFSFSLPEGVSSEVKLGGGSSQVKPASFEVIVKERK